MIAERYAETLLLRLLLQRLRQGQPINLRQLERQLRLWQPFTRPQLTRQQSNLQVAIGTEASARAYQNFLELLGLDLQVLYDEALELARRQGELRQRQLQELGMLRRNLMRLEERLQNQLLVHRETVGYHQVLADTFADLSRVDLSRTTALVDLSSRCVTLTPSQPVFRRLPLESYPADYCQVEVVTLGELVQSGLNLEGLSRIFQENADSWWVELRYRRQVPLVALDLTLRLPAATAVNRLVLRPASPWTPGLRLELYSSQDAYSWTPVPIGADTLVVGECLDVEFPTLTPTYLRCRLIREREDAREGEYWLYRFGLSSLALYHQLHATRSGIFQSLPLALPAADGGLATFSRVALEVCELLPPESTITYELSLDGGKTFQAIAPLSRPWSNAPPYLQLQEQLEMEETNVSLDFATFYPYPSNDLILLSFALPPDLLPGSLEVWRNVGERGNSWAVRQGLSGWSRIGQIYQCTIHIPPHQRAQFNFGPQPVIIDGRTYVGTVTLEAGNYRIQIQQENWSPLLNSRGEPITQIGQVVELGNGHFIGYRRDGLRLQAYDPLYPYNHRLVVEGLEYALDRTDTPRTYQGAPLFAETLMLPASPLDLEHRTICQGYQYYSLVSVIKEGVESQRLLVRYQSQVDQDNHYELERFLIRYRCPQTTLANTVILRATLTPGQAAPRLYSYLIKLSH